MDFPAALATSAHPLPCFLVRRRLATRAIVPAVASCAPSCHTQHGWWALGSVVGSTPHGPYDTDFGPYASAWAIGVVLRSLAQLRNATAEKLTPLIFERMDESLVLLLDLLGMPLEDGLITAKTSPHPSRSQWPPAAIDAYRTRLVQDGCVASLFTLVVITLWHHQPVAAT